VAQVTRTMNLTPRSYVTRNGVPEPEKRVAEERKYREEEVSEIFALATSAQGSTLPAPTGQEGLTLAELQEVGHEVGLPPERVAQAAATLDARGATLPRQKMLGFPVSAGRVVELPRAATDREWQFLLAELRETFGAKGEVSAHGSVREWSNGNLHAVLEETEAGHRLRMGTYKGNAVELNVMGAAFFGMAIMILAALISKGKTGVELFFPAFFAAAGTTALGANLLRLPRWAGEREQQMEHIAGRAQALLSGPPNETPGD
jgi:hypothetical protein